MAKEPRSSWSKNKNISVEFPSGKFLPLSQMRNNINLKKFKSLSNAPISQRFLDHLSPCLKIAGLNDFAISKLIYPQLFLAIGFTTPQNLGILIV
jgi:hypothetical protein